MHPYTATSKEIEMATKTTTSPKFTFNVGKYGNYEDACRALTKAEAEMTKKLAGAISTGKFEIPAQMFLRMDQISKGVIPFTAEDLEYGAWLNAVLRESGEMFDELAVGMCGSASNMREVLCEYERVMDKESMAFLRAQFAETKEEKPKHVYWDLLDTLSEVKNQTLRMKIAENLTYAVGGLVLAKANALVYEVRRAMEENVALEQISLMLESDGWRSAMQGFNNPLADLSSLIGFRRRLVDEAELAASAVGKVVKIKTLATMVQEEEARPLRKDQITNLRTIAEFTCEDPHDVDEVHKALVNMHTQKTEHWVHLRKMMAPATLFVIEKASGMHEDASFYALPAEIQQRIIEQTNRAIDKVSSGLAVNGMTPLEFGPMFAGGLALKRELSTK